MLCLATCYERVSHTLRTILVHEKNTALQKSAMQYLLFYNHAHGTCHIARKKALPADPLTFLFNNYPLFSRNKPSDDYSKDKPPVLPLLHR